MFVYTWFLLFRSREEEDEPLMQVDFTYNYERATSAKLHEIQDALENGDWTRFFAPDMKLKPEAGDAALFLQYMMDINATYMIISFYNVYYIYYI